MSRSIDFCKDRASDKNLSGYSDRNWDDAVEISSQPVFDDYLDGLRSWSMIGRSSIDNAEVVMHVELDINPDAEFSYFTSDSSINDGTLVFVGEHMRNCAMKVLKLQTWDSRLSVSKNNCDVKFTVGNFVLLQEYDEHGNKFAPQEKPWMAERTTVLLPIKIEIKD